MPSPFVTEVLLPMETLIFQAFQLSTQWCFYMEKRKSLLRSLLSQAVSISLRKESQTSRTKEKVQSLFWMLKSSKLTLANCNRRFERVFLCADLADLATKALLNPRSPSRLSENQTLWRRKWLNATRLSFTDFAMTGTHFMSILRCLLWVALKHQFCTVSARMASVHALYKKSTHLLILKASRRWMRDLPLTSSQVRLLSSSAGRKVTTLFSLQRQRSVAWLLCKATWLWSPLLNCEWRQNF